MKQSKKSKKSKNHQNEYEHYRNELRLRDFNEKDSIAYAKLCELYGPKPSQQELLSLAQVVSANLDILLDREAMRRKKVLIKWYDENFPKIEQFLLENVLIVDENGAAIGHDPRKYSAPAK
ncbi:hypothetical protein M9Y10_029341 [Tritrichomonas musculus]|uniref:Uncharacterized protein n=1 Tax=Tritrichomonas musculus TaxID=1915356 RepID=A0ABR2KLV2_9EUKA